jgi:hypothetical protein
VVNSSNTTADFKYTLTGPTGATLTGLGSSTTGTTAAATCTLVLVTGTSCPVATATANRTIVNVKGVITTGGTAGTVQFQVAQNTATAAASPIVLANSEIRYIKQ